jgi:hypothetical protein
MENGGTLSKTGMGRIDDEDMMGTGEKERDETD